MTFKIQRISVVPFANMLSVLHSMVGFVLGAASTVGSLQNPEEQGIWGLGPWALIVIPVANAGLGFVAGLFIANSYNFLSRWIGKVELEIEEL